MLENSAKSSQASSKAKKKSGANKRKTPPQSIKSGTPTKFAKTADETNTESMVGTAPTKWQQNDLEDDDDEVAKWNTLEHHGIRFMPPYEPHGVPILHKGKEIVLQPEEEEIANHWAQAYDTEFAEKETVKENFEKAFLKAIDPKYGIEKLADVDFSKIRKHIDDAKEVRNNRPRDEKKKETEERAKIDNIYRYCIIDGNKEKVSTTMVEPPGIFRGRGEHPLAGILKTRIWPEYVTINVGESNMIPKCDMTGHSWKSVMSNNEVTWLGHFKDEGKEKSGVKYMFLAADSTIKAKNDIKKYKKAKLLKENIDKIRADYIKRMKSSDLVQAQLGTATYLIDKLALRVGNEKSEDEADTVGCCSLRVEHVTVEEDSKITLDFLGKDSMRFHQTIDVDPVAHSAISRFVKGKKPENDLFDLINASRLNEYLKALMPGLSAKVFRTYNASITLQNELAKSEDLSEDNEEKVKFYKQANRQVAILCNHQKAVPKNFDEQVKKMEEKLDEKKKKLSGLEKHKKALKKNKSLNVKNMPKTVTACDTAIKKMKKSVMLEQDKIDEKKENKNIALSTSKINYMDPRISVTWCKNFEVPIERVFEKTLRLKFAWAMSVEPEWKF